MNSENKVSEKFKSNIDFIKLRNILSSYEKKQSQLQSQIKTKVQIPDHLIPVVISKNIDGIDDLPLLYLADVIQTFKDNVNNAKFIYKNNRTIKFEKFGEFIEDEDTEKKKPKEKTKEEKDYGLLKIKDNIYFYYLYSLGMEKLKKKRKQEGKFDELYVKLQQYLLGVMLGSMRMKMTKTKFPVCNNFVIPKYITSNEDDSNIFIIQDYYDLLLYYQIFYNMKKYGPKIEYLPNDIPDLEKLQVYPENL